VSVTPFDAEDPGDQSEIEAVIREEHMTYPCFLDAGSAWQNAMGTKGSVPYFFVIDKKGRVVFRHRNKLSQGTADYDKAAAAIEAAIAGS
jgi:peroxiredoxin